MSTTIENSGTIHATIGAGVIGTLLPETVTAGNTPIKHVTTQTSITATSSSDPSFPDTTAFTATKAGKYRFHYLISVYATRASGSSSSANCYFYFKYQIMKSSGEVSVSSIRSISATTSTTTTARTNDRDYVDITLGVGDTVRFGGYKSSGNTSSSGATMYNIFAAINWDNGF